MAHTIESIAKMSDLIAVKTYIADKGPDEEPEKLEMAEIKAFWMSCEPEEKQSLGMEARKALMAIYE